MPLTDVAIRNAKPREKPYKVGDTIGLLLLVQPSGGKLPITDIAPADVLIAVRKIERKGQLESARAPCN